ncbi:MAG: glycosyltransferase [Actinobacteria bacterium]|nr:glycosyltransferase [Actinomycetota bacterium]
MGRPVVTGPVRESELGVGAPPIRDCVYATAGWGIHDDRWMGALRTVGLEPRAISLGRDVRDAADLRSEVEAAAHGRLPVLAGPLHTVTRPLAGIAAPVVGLSWGYDFDELTGRDASWLSGLDGLMVDSRANQAAAVIYGVPEARITFLPWGIDLDRFTVGGPRVAPADLGLPDDAKLLVSLRAHETLYHVGDIVSAFVRSSSDVPTAALVIGHGGALTDSLRAVVREAGLDHRVRFLGTVPERDLAALLRGATAYVTASRADGTSVTLLQAMACGTPVIASDTAGNRGWVTDGESGLLFPVGDVGALEACLRRACHDDLTALSDRARSTVEREADWTANLARLRRAIDEASRP